MDRISFLSNRKFLLWLFGLTLTLMPIVVLAVPVSLTFENYPTTVGGGVSPVSHCVLGKFIQIS